MVNKKALATIIPLVLVAAITVPLIYSMISKNPLKAPLQFLWIGNYRLIFNANEPVNGNLCGSSFGPTTSIDITLPGFGVGFFSLTNLTVPYTVDYSFSFNGIVIEAGQWTGTGIFQKNHINPYFLMSFLGMTTGGLYFEPWGYFSTWSYLGFLEKGKR